MSIQVTWVKQFGAKDYLHNTLWTYTVYNNEYTLDIIKAMFLSETVQLVESYMQDDPVPTEQIEDAEKLLNSVKNCTTLQEFADLEYTILEDTELLGVTNV